MLSHAVSCTKYFKEESFMLLNSEFAGISNRHISSLHGQDIVCAGIIAYYKLIGY
jgi:hypothetical protein